MRWTWQNVNFSIKLKQLNISYLFFSDAADKLQQIWEKCYVSDYTKEFFMAELGPIFLYIWLTNLTQIWVLHQLDNVHCSMTFKIHKLTPFFHPGPFLVKIVVIMWICLVLPKSLNSYYWSRLGGIHKLCRIKIGDFWPSTLS